jgi:hypothetical protein
MNSQSMGALLILGGCFILWAVWAKGSPFNVKDNRFTGPSDTGASGGSGKPGGGSGFE